MALHSIFQDSHEKKQEAKKRKEARAAAGKSGPPVKGWHCSPFERAYGLQTVKALIKDLGLCMEDQIQIVGKKKGAQGSPGTDGAADSTIERYEPVWRTMRDFSFVTGDYKSAIIFCRDDCPANPFPISEDSAIHCLRFCTFKKGEPLLHYQTNLPVNDRHGGKPLLCQGIWTAESTVKTFRSALSKVAIHYTPTQGDYIQPCKGCLKLASKGIGCAVHKNNPRNDVGGSVVKGVAFKSHLKLVEEYVSQMYQSRATYGMLPDQTRMIRLACISANDAYSLMIWTLIIVSIKLFARIDETLTMKVEDLPPEYFIVVEDDLKALCATLYGKTDKVKEHMAIWDDEMCPEFAATRALMIWLKVSGITSGYIFPKRSDLDKNIKVPTSHLPYSTLCQHLKNLVSNVCGVTEDDTTIIGTHMCRKTMFLFVCWHYMGKGDEVNISETDTASICKSSRHKDVQATLAYVRDSHTLCKVKDIVCRDDPKYMVGKFQPIHIETHPHWKHLTRGIDHHRKPLIKLVDWYLYEIVQLPRGQMTIIEMCDMVCNFRPKELPQRSWTCLWPRNSRTQRSEAKFLP